MSRSRSCAFLTLVGIIILGFFFLITLLVTWQRSSQVTKALGPPSPGLNISDRLVLTHRLYGERDTLTTPTNPYGEPIEFWVQLGESPISVSVRLLEEGLIPDADTFRSYLVYSGLDTQIQAGMYTLSPNQNAIEIAEQLLDPNPTKATLVILDGWRLEEVAAALPTSGLTIAPEDFIAKTQSEELEGYLFPGSYELARTTRLETLLGNIQSAFDDAISNEMLKAFEQQGLNLHQAVILASIVERESVVDDEMPLIASVFLNRLAIGMKLETDPTVQYAMGYNLAQDTWWTNPLSGQDLQFDSPYNTYIYAGLPPGPICNPGINALRAVAFPAQTPYYYFRATCDGSGRHFFAETFQEHVNNACP